MKYVQSILSCKKGRDVWNGFSNRAGGLHYSPLSIASVVLCSVTVDD